MQHSISIIQSKLLNKEFTCLEYLDFLLGNYENRNDKLNCVLQIDKDGAKKYAFDIDEAISNGKPLGPLFGVFLGVKDNIHVDGFKTTCGSRMLENFDPGFDASCVARLRQAGACVLAKLNCDEFAMGSSNENSAFGIVRNPRAEDCVPGGSSGGSAAAVSAGMVTASLGSDTGGSIRQPAAFCGVHGLKPSYGGVSRYGLVAFSSSLDQVGPIALTGQDCALLLHHMSGKDKKDGTSRTIAPSDKPSKTRLGIVEEFFNGDFDKEFHGHLQEIMSNIRASDEFECINVSIPSLNHCLPAYYILSSAEASSNLARYDSIRFGQVFDSSKDIHGVYLKNREKGFGREVKRRILLGTYVLSEGYVEHYYRKAQKVRALLRSQFEEVLQGVDLLLGPTTPTTAFRVGEKSNDPVSMYLSDLFTVPANIIGCPAHSFPAGQVDSKPMGLQLMGSAGSEDWICEVADQLQFLLENSK